MYSYHSQNNIYCSMTYLRTAVSELYYLFLILYAMLVTSQTFKYYQFLHYLTNINLKHISINPI